MKAKAKSKKIRNWFFVLLCLGFVVAGGWVFFQRMEGLEPVVDLKIASPYIGIANDYQGHLSDDKTGLRSLWVGLLKDGKEIVLLERRFPSAGILKGGVVLESAFNFHIEPKKLGLADGKALLRVVALDWSWRNWFKGNRYYFEQEMTIDTKPPQIDVVSRFHNISQGGAGLVVYRVSEKGGTSGVQVGERFFPGHLRSEEGPYLAYVTLGYDQPIDTELFVTATDRAGNRSQAGFSYYLKPKKFRKDTIHLSDRFLRWKMPEFTVDQENTRTLSDIDKFLIVNRELRKQNTDTITAIPKMSQPVSYWKGAFLRLPGSANRAMFADYRSYIYKGQVVDYQYHMGIDLASIAKSPIPAANDGRIIFVGTIGIYGRSVVIDHGYGLCSLYSHLSRVDVQQGQMVSKGDILGLTGTTGMAGGDHLHFGMLVHNQFVNPIEWWDASWIQNNITSKLDAN